MNAVCRTVRFLLLLPIFYPCHSFAQSIVPAVDGTGTIAVPQGSQIQIQGGTQAGSNLFHSFERFNLNADQTANFLANPQIQNILGRVTGGDASIINGLIQVSGSNANLVLMNPAGILFGSTAQLNVPASFTATTATGIGFGTQGWFQAFGANDYANLLSAPNSFALTNSGAIFNAGNLSVQSGHALSLFGGTVVNVGTLSAPNGTVSIAAMPNGKLIRVTPEGSLLSFELTDSPTSSITPKSLPELLTGGQLNNANQVTIENGVVKIGSTLTTTETGTAIASGTISGNAIQIAGERIALIDAKLNAGDKVLIGGDRQGRGTFPRSQFLFGDQNTQIQATKPNAEVILWADQATRFYGQIDATGFVETSGARSLDVSGAKINAATWLLDPSDIQIASGGTGTLTLGLFDPASTATIDPATIVAALNAGTNVTISTASGIGGNGDITLVNPINQTGGGTASLTLIGRRLIRSGVDSTINMNSSGTLTIDLNRVNPEVNPPVNSIQAAIDAIGTVNGNRVIQTGSGTYRGTIFINKNVELVGTDFANSILSGENLNRVVVVDPGITATLRNLGITNGRSPEGESGGGILNLGDLTIRNSRIFNNTTQRDGGGISSFGAGSRLAILEDTRIENNLAQFGGGISSTNGVTTTIDSSNIRNNGALQGGGGIENTDGSQLTIRNSGINSNRATFGGGITLFQTGTVLIDNSSINNNIAGGNAGGINNDNNIGNINITRASISNNISGLEGGAIFNTGTMSIAAGFVNNRSETRGGAISNTATGVLNLQSSFLDNLTRNSGGAIANEGTLNISFSLFERNAAITGANPGGGAIYNAGANGIVNVSETLFQANRSGTGGAIDNTFSNSVSLNRVSFVENFADGEGGAILTDRTTQLTISDSQFFRNIANTLDGGAIYASANSILRNVILEGNRAGNVGGGIYNIGNLTISQSSFTGNSAINGGAIAQQIFAGTGSNPFLTIDSSTIANNTAIANGGGILGLSGNITTRNTTISGNSAANGSGVAITNGNANLLSTTITNNNGNVGGILNDLGNVSLQNTIVARNLGTVNPDVFGAFNDLGNNLIGISDGSTSFTLSTLVGTGTNPIDPVLAPLANNGGLTQTHALLSGSPALNAGNNTAATSKTDQRGAPRIQQTTIDIGAFESDLLPSPETPPIISVTPQPLVPTSPTLPNINPNETTSQNSPKPLIPRNTEGQQSLSRIIELDRSLSDDFIEFFGLQEAPSLTIADIQTTLANAHRQKETRSAVIYAIFVPKVITPAPKQGEVLADQVEPVTPLLRSRLKHDDDRLELILITGTGRAIRYSTNTTRAEVTEQAKLYRLAVSDIEDNQSYKALSKQLFRWLVQPLEADLQKEKITSLIYCFDEGLRTLPIAAMSDDRGFVTDRYKLSIIPSMALINRDLRGLSDRTLLAMGADQFRSLEPLPAVPTELQLVSEQFWKGNRFLNQEFTLERLQQEKKRANPGIIHLATHARFNPGSPDQSYIQFWDRQVKLSEMRSLQWSNPPLQLLVLSACDTAIGSREAELGFAGLAAASGVHSVIGSLWEISDIGTLALMSEFYTQLQQAPTRAEALRRAQVALRNGTVRIENGVLITSKTKVPLPKKLLKSDESLDFKHPFYWSAFTLVGNPW